MPELDMAEHDTNLRKRARERLEKKRDFKAFHGGWVAPGFEEVRGEFDRNFAERSEIGASVAAYWRGEKVVDLWGGRQNPPATNRGTRAHWSSSIRRPRVWRR